MRNWEFNIFKKLIKKSEKELQNDLYKILVNYYDHKKVKYNSEYVCAYGDIPIALIAHIDTVFSNPPQIIYYDRKNSLIYSPNGGVGDDRAGVFAILKILTDGYRPTVFFTCGEEYGGIGATALIQKHKKCPVDLKYIIELDRHGINDCVFYNCENNDFIDYVESFGFEFNLGSFSDISIICPQWEIAGVNLSIGYFNEHSKKEFLLTEAWRNTIKKVEKMLDNSSLAHHYKYISSSDYICEKCGKSFSFLKNVYDGKKLMKVCWNCLNDSLYCYECDENFFPIEEDEDEIFCEEYQKKYDRF